MSNKKARAEAGERKLSNVAHRSTLLDAEMFDAWHRGYFRAAYNPDSVQLIRQYPPAFILLFVIAFRARWKMDGFNPHKLRLGEALVGDWANYGMSEQQYRTAKQKLEEWGFATFEPTPSKGTIATLKKRTIFDFGPVHSNEPTNTPATDESQASHGGATGEPRITKKEKNQKKGNEGKNGNLKDTVSPKSKPRFISSPPTDEEFTKYGEMMCYRDDCISTCLERLKQRGWRDTKGQPVHNWQAYFDRFADGWGIQ